MLEALSSIWEQDYLSKACLADRTYVELTREVSEAQNTLKEKLSEKDFKQAVEVMDMMTAADMRNVHIAYIEGIKSGIRLVIEALL